MRKQLTIGTTVVLLLLGLWHVFAGSEFYIDVTISLVALLVVSRVYEKLRLDTVAFGVFCIWLILHNIGLYDKVVILIRWDLWMHLFGGFTLALMADRLFAAEKWGQFKRSFVIVFIVLGLGGFHEILEWLGYGYLGAGDGFLFYGEGDFGEWRNTILDMIFNLLGALVAVFGAQRLNTRRKPTST